jgi:hypothetical protein
MMDKLGAAKVFSCFDATSAYWSILMHEEDVEKTAFVVRNGHWEWTALPMGMKNSAAVYTRFMTAVLSGLEYAIAYMDDVLVHTTDWKTHWLALEETFERFRRFNVKISPKKSIIGRQRVQYLGFVVGDGKIAPVRDKVTAIETIPYAKNLKEVRSFVCTIGFYRRFIPHFAAQAEPLLELMKTKRRRRFEFGPQQKTAWDTLKKELAEATLLNIPDNRKEFWVGSDASDTAIGAVLYQKDAQGRETPIEFYSRTLSDAERNYAITEREMLAGVEAIRKWRIYLLDKPFHWITDHQAIMWLVERVSDKTNAAPKLRRWAMYLSEMSHTRHWREGESHIVPDALSRLGGETSDEERSDVIQLGKNHHPGAELLVGETDTVHYAYVNSGEECFPETPEVYTITARPPVNGD